MLKKKLKDLKAAMERDKKQEERELRARERLTKVPTPSAGVGIKKYKFFGK